MNNMDFSQIELRSIITHHVGNKLREENCLLSQEPSSVGEDTLDYLIQYFLLPMKVEEVYSFTHSVELEMNEVYAVAKRLFEDPDSFVEASQSMARLLYEQSTHPKIKEGEFHVALFSNVVLDDQEVEAIGIFKSETRVPYLTMSSVDGRFHIEHEEGFEVKGIDKGCLILRAEAGRGFRVLIVDHANKSAEAQYWRDDFLNVEPVRNEYHQTQKFLGLAKDFVVQTLPEEFEVSKADKIDLLNRSVAYFKNHESFDKQEFEEEVFQDEKVIKSFQAFDESYRDKYDLELSDQFEISPEAVKKQARIFKSVLKLDKNFHIYIHGRRELIEQGVDQDGRKYYKIYYEQES